MNTVGTMRKAILTTMLCALVQVCGFSPTRNVAIADQSPAQIERDHEPHQKEAANSESGLPTKPLYRPENSIPGEDFDAARDIMDEVIRNGNGRDDFLNDDELKRTAGKADSAKKYLTGNSPAHRTGFRLLFDGLKSTYEDATEKSNRLTELNKSIERELGVKEKEFHELAEGDEAFMHILKGLGFKVGGYALGKALEEGLTLMKKAHAGKLIGAAGVVLGIYQYCLVADEYTKMKLLLEDMLELVELRAYVRGLLSQYRDLVNRLYVAIDELEELKNIWLDQAPKQRRNDDHRLVFLSVPEENLYFCPSGFFLTGVYYSDSDSGEDKSIKHMRCSRLKNPAGSTFLSQDGEPEKLQMNGEGTKWYDCPSKSLVVGAYYSNSDYSIEEFRYAKSTVPGSSQECSIAVRARKKIQMRGRGTAWYNCPDRYFVTGAYYRDDDTEPDDSIETIRCSLVAVNCR
jgi:hypothetical protein